MIVHVLNGDALQSQLPAAIGPCIVMRECMIEGPHDSEDTSVFWKNRCEYFINTFQTTKEKYNELVVTELEKLKTLEAGLEICLWFEYDLFCQTNMWYIISALKSEIDAISISWAQPDHDEWTGFGGMNPERLEQAFKYRVKLSTAEINILNSFWHHYVQRDMIFFKTLDLENKTILSNMAASVKALIELYPEEGEARPKELLRTILSENSEADFGRIFRLFSQQAGDYGYGDLQVKNLFDKLNQT